MRIAAAASLLLTAIAAAQQATPLEAGASLGFSVPSGTIAKLFASTADHQVVSPTSLCVDEQGRLLVTETHRLRSGVEDNRDHPYWVLDDLAGRTTDDRRNLHMKWNHKVPIESLSSKSEKIRLLVDRNNDGFADESTVFADGFNDLLDGAASGIFSLDGTTYLACIPHIWTLHDDDGDGIAEQRARLLSGFGTRVSLSGHDLSGFALGPDGRIYGTIGDRSLHVRTREGTVATLADQGAVFRFEPDGSQFEIVHSGLRNPKEIAFDQWGNAITVDNNADQGDKARLVYIMEGADSGWRVGHQTLHTFHKEIGCEDRPINQWMQERQWEPRHDQQPAFLLPPVANIARGPSGLAYYPGTGLSNDCLDSFLVCDYTGGAASSGIRAFGIETEGAGMKIVNPRKWCWGVAVTDVEFGYDDRVYVSDFIGGWQSHDQGKIYAIEAKQAGEPPPGDGTRNKAPDVAGLIRAGFGGLESEALYTLLGHPDQRARLRAQIALSKRSQAFVLFTKACRQTENRLQRLHGVWGLWSIARKEKSRDATAGLLALLGDPDAEVRSQVARALGEAPLVDPGQLAIALRDSSDRVKAFAALSLARLKAPGQFNDVVALLGENGDRDPYLRHAGVMALLGCGTVDQIAALKDNPIPAVRLAAVIALRRSADPSIVQFLFDKETPIADEVIRAIHDAGIEKARPAVAGLLDNYAPGKTGRPLSRMMMRRLIHSAFQLGEAENAVRLLRFAANPSIDNRERLEALRLVALWPEPPAVDQSLGRLMALEPREEAPIKAVIEKELPALLSSEDVILAATLGLVARYEIIDDRLDDASLAHIATDRAVGSSARLRAVELLATRGSGNAPDLLLRLTNDPDPTLSAKADSLLVTLHPERAVSVLQKALASESAARKQNAWQLLRTVPGQNAAEIIVGGLELLSRGGAVPPYALELLEAAEFRSEPNVKAALATWKESLPPEDPLASWRVALNGGDPAEGAALFQSHPAGQCLRCHSAGGGPTNGGDVGPSLRGVGTRLTSEKIFRSIVDPSATIVEGFGTVTLTFDNGGSLSGVLQYETESHLDLLVGEDRWRINKADLRDRSNPVSAMPPMMALLTKSEIRDLVAYLVTLDEGETTVPATGVAKIFDPATVALQQPDTAADTSPNAAAVIDPVVLKMGKEAYTLCMACHGPTGRGSPGIGPPLAGSEWVHGPPENLIRIQLRGLGGPITVRGREYTFPAPMMAQAFQTDEQIAAVLTYVRNSFGNRASPITPDMVTALRDEVGTPPLTVADLIPPGDPPELTKEPNPAAPGSETLPDGERNWPWWATVLIVLWLALCAVPIARKLMGPKDDDDD